MFSRFTTTLSIWFSRTRARFLGDPFRAARYQLMALYLISSIVVFGVLGWFVSSVAFKPVYEMFQVQSGSPAEAAYLQYQQDQLERRVVLLMIIGVCTYFLAEFALVPVRKATQVQKHFIAVASHELRTPLTIMKNMAEVALRNQDSLTREKAIGIIVSNLEETNRLSDTVEFLLTLSSLRSKKEIPNVESISLSDVVARSTEMFKNEFLAKNISLVPKMGTLRPMPGNRIALDGLITNLIKNALQHTPKGGTVTVAAEESFGHIRLSVANTGPRIPRGDIPYIFEPFFRGSGSQGVGFGLGLSIARQSALLHHGIIQVTSNDTTGTVFTVIFSRSYGTKGMLS